MECRSWVNNGSPAWATECPKLGDKRKSISGGWMSACSHKRKSVLPLEVEYWSPIQLLDEGYHRGKPGPPERRYSECGRPVRLQEVVNIVTSKTSAATVFPSRRRDVMGGPEWLLEPRQETAADPGLIMVVSALAMVSLASRYTTSADMIISFVSKGKDHANHTVQMAPE